MRNGREICLFTKNDYKSATATGKNLSKNVHSMGLNICLKANSQLVKA